jgi:hypothetical protein
MSRASAWFVVDCSIPRSAAVATTAAVVGNCIAYMLHQLAASGHLTVCIRLPGQFHLHGMTDYLRYAVYSHSALCDNEDAWHYSGIGFRQQQTAA